MLYLISGASRAGKTLIAEKLSKQTPRLSKQAAKQVMLDIKDHIEGTIDETQLSLYLQSHGF